MLTLALALPACGKKLDEQLRDTVRTFDNAALKEKDVEILQVTESGDLAVAEVKIRTAFKLRKVNGAWVLEEIRIGDRRWEKAEHILEAIQERRVQTTRRQLELLTEGIARFAEERGAVPQSADFAALVDVLAPAYMKQVVRLDAWSSPYSYSPLSDRAFDLRSAGPDGEFHTPDDLVAGSAKP